MAFAHTSGRLGLQSIASTSTTQQHELGLISQADDSTYGSGEFIYLLGVASTAIGSWVKYNPDDYSTSLATANDRGLIAVAMSANVASQYGWYQIKGKAVGKALASYADNGNVYLTSTAGSVDDAAVAGDLINGALGASAVGTPSTGLAEFEIDYPRCGEIGIEDAEDRTFSGAVNLSGTFSIGGTQVTSTAAELNILDGVTSTAAELNILDGVTATTAELNEAADKSTNAVVALTADTALTQAAHAGKIVTIGSADGDTITLPAATGTGDIYTVVVATTVTSNNHIIQAASASDSFAGICLGVDTDAEGASGYTWNADSGDDTVTMDGSAKGGLIGDKWIITDIASGVFQVDGRITQSGGSEVTPFSAAVS